MRFLYHFECDDYLLALAHFEESEEELWSHFSVLRDAYQTYLSEYHLPKRRFEFLRTRLLLKTLIGREVWVSHTEEGKPYISDESYSLSISHAGDYVAVMLGKTVPVGVDVELKREKLFRVQHKFLGKEESALVEELEDREMRLRLLLLHWCAKEAIFKRYEKSLPEFSEEIMILPFDFQKDEGIFQVVAEPNDSKIPITLRYKMFGDLALVYTID
jgi:4'-phosphopantetheinyl transferase EntD